MIDVKFEWTFPDSVIFLPHNCLVIVVWLFCCLHLGNVDRMEDDFLWKTTSYLLSRRAVVYGLQTATCPFRGVGRCTGSRDLCTYRRRTSIPYHHCNHRPQIPAGNRQVKHRSDGEQYRPLLWRACRDFGSGRWLRKHLCRGWKLRP